MSKLKVNMMDMHFQESLIKTPSYDFGIQNFAKFLNKYNRFIISTHQSPDGDAIGSEIALNEFLNSIDKDSIIINHDPVPYNLKFVDMDNEILWIDDLNWDLEELKDRVLIVVDAHLEKRIGSVSQKIGPFMKDIFFVDHHQCPPEYIKKYFCMEQATSTGEIIYYIIQNFKGQFTYKNSQAIYTAILTDTGSFRFPKTDWRTHHIVSKLLKNGVNPSAVYQEVFENKSRGHVRLLKSFLDTMSFEFQGKLVFAYLTDEMLQEAGVDDGETDGFVNMPLENRGVRVSILLKVFGGQKKVSLRSKGAIDVSDIAARFDGGGHFNASGFRFKDENSLDIQAIKEKILYEFNGIFPSKEKN